MNLCNRTLVYIVIFTCVSFFSCEKKDAPSDTSVTDAVPEIPDGTPVITEHPKSASYLEYEGREELTVKASVREEYNLSYQWYTMQFDVSGYYLLNFNVDGSLRNPTQQEISIEVNKFINNPGDSRFRELYRETGQTCFPHAGKGQTVYICVVTGTSLDGSVTFTAVSDPAVITIVGHPLMNWYSIDERIFAYRRNNRDAFMRLRDIAYGNGYFVAVGDRYGDIYSNREGLLGIIAYSNDRRTWELIRDSPFGKYGSISAGSISSVAYGDGRFIAVGANGKMAYSTDIKTWIPVESIVSESFTNIVYGNGGFIASFGSGLVYSDDGETWASVEGLDASRISCIAYGNNRFIAGTHDGKIFFSDDGKTWITTTDNTFDFHEIVTVACGNGRYLVFARDDNDWGSSSYKMGYSDDGETWVNVTPSSPKEGDGYWKWIEEIIYSEGYFVAVGGDKTAFSEDGIYWTNLGESSNWNYFRNISQNFNAIAHGGGFFVAVSDNGIIDYCQWPIDKAVAPIITEHPKWPSGSKDSEGRDCIRISIEDVSYGRRSYQWYRNNTDSTSGGIAIEGANWFYYAPDVSKAGTTYYYAKATNTIPDYFYVEAKNREASVTSNTVAVTVDIPD
jgi:hypothetical protein